MKKQGMAVLFLAAAGWAQELDLSFLKGLEEKATESTNITLGKEQLKLLSGFTNESAELKALAGGLELVQVRVLEFDKEGMFKIADMEALKAKVKGEDTVPFLSVKEKDGFTEILMRKGAKGLRGFVILAAESKELTVVNIVGDLDLASLGRLAGKFGIPDIALENKAKPKSDASGKKDEDNEEEN